MFAAGPGVVTKSSLVPARRVKSIPKLVRSAWPGPPSSCSQIGRPLTGTHQYTNPNAPDPSPLAPAVRDRSAVTRTRASRSGIQRRTGDHSHTAEVLSSVGELSGKQTMAEPPVEGPDHRPQFTSGKVARFSTFLPPTAPAREGPQENRFRPSCCKPKPVAASLATRRQSGCQGLRRFGRRSRSENC
jgi:hypothetical protein